MNVLVNEICGLAFRHKNGTAGVTPWTARLVHNGAITALSVIEIGSGYYEVRFTPTSTGEYFVDINETADTATRYQRDVVVETGPGDISKFSRIEDSVKRINNKINSLR